jgi:hypothetical protein
MRVQSPPPAQTSPLAALPLFNLPPIDLPKDARGLTRYERFVAFNAANPHVYETLRKMALAAKRAGRQRGGVKAMLEVLRWSSITTRGEDWKINNDFAPFYSRLLKRNNPELVDFFADRESEADNEPSLKIVAHSPQEQAGVSAAPSRAALPQGHSSF